MKGKSDTRQRPRRRTRRIVAVPLALLLLWVGGLVTLGYFFGNVPFIKKNLSLLVVAIILLSLVPMIIGVVRSRFGGTKVQSH